MHPRVCAASLRMEAIFFLTFPGNISAMPVFNALSGCEAQFLCGDPPFGV
ncbi:hypothetical protein SAMN05428953_101297 [Mesorhizobium muleiense]|uniref:Uncharacterized protein n=1 Tax=Mesorhizobium muleiense TaxID=1004279 RepID=A0A1G8I977_9HYPH|nr:hypothetical protein SAMN05428953_101297 [Mesorhizobium muleiense]